MQRRFGREVKWDLLIFGLFKGWPHSPQQRNEESGYINEFETIFPVLMQRQFGKGSTDFGFGSFRENKIFCLYHNYATMQPTFYNHIKNFLECFTQIDSP